MRDLPGPTFDAYVEALQDSFVAQAWPPEWAPDVGQDLLETAHAWEAETVLERHLDFVGVRFDPRTGCRGRASAPGRGARPEALPQSAGRRRSTPLHAS